MKSWQEYIEETRERGSEHKFTKSLKKRMLKKANYQCQMCFTALNMATADPHHIIPVCRGGETVSTNCQILCRKCHEQVHQNMK